MVRAEVSTTIKRPIDEVFAVMSDASKNPRWASGISETTKTSDGFESDTRYTEFEPNRKVTAEITTPFPMTIAYSFESVADGTRVDQVFDGEPGGFFKLVGPLLVAAAKRQFQNDLDNFRDLMEADALAD
jgi:carbon monoxide dehydrogenase subunit G